MRNALSVISTDMRISVAKRDVVSATGPESLHAANARMVGLATFHLEYLDRLVRDIKNALDNNKIGLAEAYTNQAVGNMEDLKKRAERHAFLD